MAVSRTHFVSSTNLEWGGHSRAERDRRWGVVRHLAAEAGFDGILIPLGDGLDARYLTQLRNACFVLPVDGDPVAITDRGATNDWLEDPIHTGRAWTEALVEAVRRAGMESRRMGVAGLWRGKLAHVTAANGAANYSALADLQRLFPDATFGDATDVLGQARFVKGPEEIECLEKATAMAESAIERLVEVARPGADQAEAYAAVVERLLELGSEYYPLVWCYTAPKGAEQRFTNPPTGLTLQRGGILACRVHAIWGGQVALEEQWLSIGQPNPSLERVVPELPRALAFARQALRPGVELAELQQTLRQTCGSFYVQSRGLGDDGPLMTEATAVSELAGLRLEEAAVVSLIPRIEDLAWGGSFVVRAGGAEPLFSRTSPLVTTD